MSARWAALPIAALAALALRADSRLPNPVPFPELPVRFEPSGRSEYRSQGAYPTIVLKSGKATIYGPAGKIQMSFPGSRSVTPEADDSRPSISNYFVGSNRAKWRTNVPAYSSIRYRSLYPGIDLVFYGNAGRLEYDFVVQPGADPSIIRISLEGARRIELTERGDLAIAGAGAHGLFLRPTLYQDSEDGRQGVAGSYELAGNTIIRFHVASYDRSLPLVIDPALTYATFFGGSGGESAYAVATDSSGNMYVAGSTSSADASVTAAALASQFGGGNFDSFVAKFGPSGALIYSTYLGGSGDEQAYGLAVDSQGNAYLTGYTTSTNFPVTQGAYGGSLVGSSNAFVAKLNPAGTALLYSSYLGGGGSDMGYGVAVDASGDAFVTGSTSSVNFPVSTGAYRGTYAGGTSDAFVTKLGPSGGTLLYSTYVGGSDQDQAYAIALDSKGDAYVAGETLSVNFPNTPASIQSAENGSFDGFVTVLNPAGTSLVYSTLLGGTLDDYACGIAVDSVGNAYVSGYTGSSNFPHTAGVLQPGSAGGYDAFVTKINPSGTSLVYSTLLGGSGDDYALPIAVDSGGNVYITGDTTSSNFPLTADAAQSTALGGYTAFVAVLNSDGSALRYGSYLGGSISQTGWGIALTPAQQIVAVGYTASPDFPVTAAAFQKTLSGATDAFVAGFSALSLPILAVTLNHTGNFTPGQVGATYSITVGNSGGAGPTSGTVTVAESLPIGLTSASMAGTGWTCPSGGNSCTRNDPLTGGSPYPPIVVTVDVSQTVANQVTNQVTVTGGGAPAATGQDTTSILLLAPQTVTFSALPSQSFGASSLPISATASSGLPVSFASTTSTTCSTSGTTVTLLAVGTCTIQATQSGNANYAVATAVNQSFQITPASQSITFGTLSSQAFGTGPFSVSAAASSGLAVSFASTTSATCSVSGTTVTLVAVGTCTIQATQSGNANYSAAASVNQTFSVTAGIATLGASSLNFGNTVAGKSSAIQTVTFQNTGNAALTITSITPAGSDAANYQYTADPTRPCPITPATLGAGTSCTLDIAFLPVSAGMHASAQLTVVDNSANVVGATQTVSLSGVGIVLSAIAVSASGSSVASNGGAQFTAIGTYSDNSTANLTGQVAWASSAPSVASINASGMAVGLSAGHTNISAVQAGVTSNSFQLTVVAGTQSTISAVAGSGQAAMLGMPFASALQAMVKDGAGNAVANATVMFTAPSNGPGGMFANGLASYSATTNNSGIATSLTLTANPTAGTYLVTAAATGVVSPASFSMTNMKAPQLSIVEAPVGVFVQGQNATYTLTVANAAGAGPTSGTVTVTESVPNGFTLIGMDGGPVWNCTKSGSCTTNLVLSGGSSYPSIAVILGPSSSSTTAIANLASVSGGGSAPAGASDPTPVFSRCDINQDGNLNAVDVQRTINEALGAAAPRDDLNGDGIVNVLDIQIIVNALFTLTCSG